MNTCTNRHLMHAVAAAALLACAGSALATNGYFSHGYGLKAKGMGGASLAMTDNAFGGANNPATMVLAGSRLDLGVDDFMPKRDAERSGAGVTIINGKVESDKTAFYVPELAYNQALGSDMSLGVTVYGNGGLNTDYPQGSYQCPTGPTTVAPANALCGSGRLGVDMMQLIVAPTFAMKINSANAIGVSPLLGYQRFKAEGLQPFQGISSSPSNVTNNGYDSSTGLGLRLGWLGQLAPQFSLGVSYATRMHMGKFEKYKGLFAEGGGFDIPSNYGIGLAFVPVQDLTVAVDFTRINYSSIASIGNPSSNQAPLGAANGPGFGWKDVNVFKLGLSWKQGDALTLRAGYNKGDNPITSSDVSFNILAPGVTTTHYTLGATLAMGKTDEITGAFMHSPRNSVTGGSLFNSPAFFGPGGGGSETIGMSQRSLGIAWSRKF